MIVKGEISALLIDNSGAFERPSADFWKSEGSKYTTLSSKEIEDLSYIEELSLRNLCIDNDAFQRRIERIVRTLPLKNMPQGLLFLARFDTDGDTVPLTYMSIDVALETFVMQRKAYTDQSIDEVWATASTELRDLLHTKVIRSFHRDRSGFVRQIDPAEWCQDGPIINRISHSTYGRNGFGINSGIWLSYIDVLTEKGPLWGEIIVQNQDVLLALGSATGDILLAQTAASHQERTSAEVKDTGGRPPKYDAESFLLEVVKIVLDGAPNQKKDLRERAQSAYELKGLPGGRPDDEWARKRIARYWKEFDLR